EIKDYYKTVNIYKFSKHFSEHYYVPFLEAYQEALGVNEYYEQVLRVITMLDDPEIRAKRLNGQLWYEIDDIQDLDIATSMFTPDEEEKVDLMAGRYGGYWRYPQLLDFCYLVNPYFPPQKLIDELKASFEKLLTQYPSGMRVNSLLAAKNFGIHQPNVVVGNGAAELIKSFMSRLSGKVGFVRPTFEEYPNRYCKDGAEVFVPQNPDFSYTAQDLMDFFDQKDITSLVVVNPDNPSGNYITKASLLELIAWAKAKGIRLLIDESFVDFAEETDSTLICQELLSSNPHLYVMKSISKSYGVPGLRLGILASGDEEMIAWMKKDVSIWNINSFGEFYLQIAEKYQKDYVKALELIRAERSRFQKELQKLPGLRIIPSQANYIMAELTGSVTARELTKLLLLKYNLFIKDLSAKLQGGQYVRLAVRNTADNDKLLAALKQELV
ncbi:MAG: aminotransferase class I/II-fold pyridoxal phosphate-dependent enzyme, partial [Oscillospiraceae bacterium]|nr:aminotransferase class I/II-fold pyridoxal phosphate-dependent enzyme [Oscillospiraceae bacterium]